MFRLIPFVAFAAVAACEPMPVNIEDRVLPAEVRAFLLPGQPESIVIQDGQGCYLISNQLEAPRSGYFLRDQATNEPLCYDRDGMRIPYVAPEAPATEPADAAA